MVGCSTGRATALGVTVQHRSGDGCVAEETPLSPSEYTNTNPQRQRGTRWTASLTRHVSQLSEPGFRSANIGSTYSFHPIAIMTIPQCRTLLAIVDREREIMIQSSPLLAAVDIGFVLLKVEITVVTSHL